MSVKTSASQNYLDRIIKAAPDTEEMDLSKRY